MTLEDLNKKVKKDLAYLNINVDNWNETKEIEENINYDVVIIGGGQSGLGTAFGLLREGVTNILIIDENSENLEGPWVNYARMRTLRTGKDLISIDLGIPSLTFQSWWEAQYGEDSWKDLDKIPRESWMNYLVWYKEILNIPIKNKTKVNEIKSINKNNFQLTITNPSSEQINIYAHKIVLATGIQGGGEWSVPSVVSESLPKSLYAHSSEIIDFNELDGKDIGILGGGASAFDTAKTALEKGANSAHVFIRRRELPKVNPIKKMSELGVWEHYYDLSDDDKYTIMKFFMENQPPTNESFQKASEFENFKFYTEESWDNVELQDNKIIVTTPKNKHQFDYLITATGTNNDLTLRPELKNFEPYIERWKDHFTSVENLSNAKIDAHPYLKANFEFTSKSKEAENKLHGLFVFNYSSLISHGLSTSVLTGLRYGLNKITTEISKQLFFDNKERILNDVYKYDEIEFTGELYVKN